VVQSAERPSGSVTLGLPHSISGALAVPLLSAIRQRYPEITLQLTEELTGNLAEQLRAGRVNLAVLLDDGQLAALPPPRWSRKNCATSAPQTRRWAPGATASPCATRSTPP
jgi:DNA-binding transcriptional LysR family regulator